MLIIIGAGLSGLSCAFKLSRFKDFIVIEKEKKPGGLCRTLQKQGFLFDFSGHLLHLRWKETSQFVLNILDGNVQKIKRNAQIYLKKIYTDYPFQINLYNLPQEIKLKCVRDFIKAQITPNKPDIYNFRNWSESVFGKSISKYFMIPYNEKLYSTPAESFTALWIEKFVPIPSITDVVNGAYIKKIENTGYNYEFYYPLKGGIETLVNKIYENVKEKVLTDSEVIYINFSEKKLKLKNSKIVKYKKLVSTIPLKDLILISDAPSYIKNEAKKLKHNTIYILNIGIKKTHYPQHWIYFPEKNIPFYRAGFYANFSPFMAPEGFSSLYLEFSTNPDNYFDMNYIEKKSINWLKKLGVIKNHKDISVKMWTKIDCAYVIYNRERESAVKKINDFLKHRNALSIGRYGAWKYSFMEENIKDGFEAALNIIKEAR